MQHLEPEQAESKEKQTKPQLTGVQDQTTGTLVRASQNNIAEEEMLTYCQLVSTEYGSSLYVHTRTIDPRPPGGRGGVTFG